MLTTAANIKLLEVGLRKVFDEAEVEQNRKSIIPMLFDVIPSEKAWEEFYTVSALGDLQPWQGKLDYGNMYPGYWTRLEPGEFSLAVQIERKFIKDNQYPVMNNIPRSLAIAKARTREKQAVKVLAYAFSTAFPFARNEEGVAMCSNSHTTKVPGVSTSTGLDNLGTSAINKTALQTARIAYRKLKTSIGEMQDEIADTVICGTSLRPAVEEAIGESGMAKSDKDPDSLNLVNTEYGKWKIIEIPRLDDYDTNNWFICNGRRLKDSLKWVNRDQDSGMLPIDDTLGPRYFAYDRYGFAWLDWRAIYGNQVS